MRQQIYPYLSIYTCTFMQSVTPRAIYAAFKTDDVSDEDIVAIGRYGFTSRLLKATELHELCKMMESPATVIAEQQNECEEDPIFPFCLQKSLHIKELISSLPRI